MTLVRRPWFLIVFFGLAVLLTRVPLAPGQLFTFDDVNLAYSVGHFDVRTSQPQPPGYPLFVMEMRLLSWLRFRRAENILFTLALLGSTAVLVLMTLAGNRIFGGNSGFYAACLFLLHPVFWHTGLASALRIQLGLLSLAVGAACWRAWTGEGRWVLWSALVLGVGAGVRPEAGPVLFPLWAVCALAAPVTWRDRARALGAMAGGILLWLLPAMMASGGPVSYVKTCLAYLTDQASVSSGLFGATEVRWEATLWHLMVWTCCGAIGWAMPAVLALRRDSGWALRREQVYFLLLWLLPAAAFSVMVHIEDPGQALGMTVVVALVGGYLVNRALDVTVTWISRYHGLTLALGCAAAAWVLGKHGDVSPTVVTWIAAATLATGLALKTGQTKNAGNPPRWTMVLFLMTPPLFLTYTLFQPHMGWYYRGSTAWDHTLEDVNSGLALTSLDHIRATLAVDDHTFQQVQRLSAERPGRSVVVWERGLAAWRKTAYYAGAVPIFVLEHRMIRSSPPVVTVWKGPKMLAQRFGAAPLRFDIGEATRVIWLLNPRTEFYGLAGKAFPLTSAGPVYYTDLPEGHGSRIVGEYELAW